jgi:hypothetical protein
MLAAFALTNGMLRDSGVLLGPSSPGRSPGDPGNQAWVTAGSRLGA